MTLCQAWASKHEDIVVSGSIPELDEVIAWWAEGYGQTSIKQGTADMISGCVDAGRYSKRFHGFELP